MKELVSQNLAISALLVGRERGLEINKQSKDILKCVYHNKNKKFETALVYSYFYWDCMFLLFLRKKEKSISGEF